MSKEEILDSIKDMTLSVDGKKPASKNVIKSLNYETLIRLRCAIDRSKNLISITDIKGEQLPNEMNILTYSFPCQDLSVAGAWHGNKRWNRQKC